MDFADTASVNVGLISPSEVKSDDDTSPAPHAPLGRQDTLAELRDQEVAQGPCPQKRHIMMVMMSLGYFAVYLMRYTTHSWI